MKNFERKNQLLSLCGLNCGLCTMYLDNYCPGCGGGPGNQSCSIARCSKEHENIEYCFECQLFPCKKYQDITKYDSFISHQHMFEDLTKAKNVGVEIYNQEQQRKIEILKYLLSNYNDGRKKNFYCVAINLLSLDVLDSIIKEINCNQDLISLPIKEQAKYVSDLFKTIAKKQQIELKLHKKPKK